MKGKEREEEKAWKRMVQKISESGGKNKKMGANPHEKNRSSTEILKNLLEQKIKFGASETGADEVPTP